MKHKYLLGVYDDDDRMMAGVKALGKEGYRIHEAFTPFPVHGLDPAMGLKETRLHITGFIYGAIGLMFAITAMGWISAIDWPVIVGGKPFFSLPAFIPIAFEVTVLYAAVGMVITYYIRNNFAFFYDKEIVDPRTSDDKFILAMDYKRYNSAEDVAKITNIFQQTGAVEIKDRLLDNELPPNRYEPLSKLAEVDNHH